MGGLLDHWNLGRCTTDRVSFVIPDHERGKPDLSIRSSAVVAPRIENPRRRDYALPRGVEFSSIRARIDLETPLILLSVELTPFDTASTPRTPHAAAERNRVAADFSCVAFSVHHSVHIPTALEPRSFSV
jgi:hypothetical protein